MKDSIAAAKAQFQMARAQLETALVTTPEDRLNWSPSPTSRTTVQMVGHAASAIQGLHGLLEGKALDFPSAEAADRSFREAESRLTSREEVQATLRANADAFEAWLDALPPERLSEMVELPFGFGQAPMSFAIGLPASHTNYHAAQINYLQTIYGDRTWH